MAELSGSDGEPLSLERSDEGSTPVLRLIGTLDLSTVDRAAPLVDATLSPPPDRVIFDLSELEFMDSSGIALLLSAAQRVQALEVRSPSPVVRRVIELTGLSDILAVNDGS